MCTPTNRHCTTTITRKIDELPDMCFNAQHEQSNSNHMCNQNLLIQTFHNHINTNLLAYVSHHRLWLKKLPQKLTPAAKQKEASGLACHPYIFSDFVLDDNDHPIYKHWNASPVRRETMLSGNPPIARMGVSSTKHVVATHYPSLIKRA